MTDICRRTGSALDDKREATAKMSIEVSGAPEKLGKVNRHFERRLASSSRPYMFRSDSELQLASSWQGLRNRSWHALLTND